MSKVAKKEVNLDKGSVLFAFANDAGTLETSLDALTPAMQRHLALHGLAQKVGDSYAGADNEKDAFAFASETYKDLVEEKWATRSASSGPKISALAEAVSRLKGISVEDATGIIANLVTADEANKTEKVKGLRANADVAAMMATINAERKAAKAQAAKEAGGASLDSLLTA